jgi:uncharacterized membrane protein/uncharacterized membrane protein YeaQ/YmgE (transglycosylase-associated protein family)
MHVLTWLMCGVLASVLAYAIARDTRWGAGGDLALGLLGATLGGWLLHASRLVAPDHVVAHALVGTSGAACALVGVRWLASAGMRAGAIAIGSPDSASAPALEAQVADLREAERRVLARLLRRVRGARDPNAAFDEELTVGQRAADRVAAFGGSWSFIGIFAAVMIAWIVYNEEGRSAFDPFPFILLNLALSCVGAIQAPFIMMSQERMAAKDRSDARHDYEVNLRAEMEIMSLHAKLDELLADRWSTLLALQERQITALERIEQGAALGEEAGLR